MRTTLDDQVDRLKELLPGARSRAAMVGSMSPLWDCIFDAEALIKGERTLTGGTEEEVAARLIDWLQPPQDQ